MLQRRMKIWKESACIQKIADGTDKNYRIQMMKHEVFFWLHSRAVLFNFFCVWAWVRPEFSKVFAKKKFFPLMS